MNVLSLQQFLRSLVDPLSAAGATTKTTTDLEKACQGLEPFHEKDIGEFAEFLVRSQAYERDGHWPSVNPPICGGLVDDPSIPEYAKRLKSFLAREVPPGSSVTPHVRQELTKLEVRLKVAELHELAKELGVEGAFSKKNQGIRLIVLKLTGQKLAGKGSTPTPIVNFDAAQLADKLRSLSGTPELNMELETLLKQPIQIVRAVANVLGISGVPSRPKGVSKIRDLLASVPSPNPKVTQKPETSTPTISEPAQEGQANTQTQLPPGDSTSQPDANLPRSSKIARLTEIIAELKTKAEMPDAPYDEIEAELRSVEEQMDKDEAIEVAEKIGVVRRVTSRKDAVEAIHRKVFEAKRARDSIAY